MNVRKRKITFITTKQNQMLLQIEKCRLKYLKDKASLILNLKQTGYFILITTFPLALPLST